MTHLTSGTTFAVCFTACLCADSWADKPLPALVGVGVVLGVVIALARLANRTRRHYGQH